MSRLFFFALAMLLMTNAELINALTSHMKGNEPKYYTPSSHRGTSETSGKVKDDFAGHGAYGVVAAISRMGEKGTPAKVHNIADQYHADHLGAYLQKADEIRGRH